MYRAGYQLRSIKTGAWARRVSSTVQGHGRGCMEPPSMTLTHCQHCGLEIIQGQYYAESDDGFKARLASGFCRSKCRRLATPARSERIRPSLELISHNVGRVETVAQPLEVPVVDEKYRAWVRSLPCMVPGCAGRSQFHHQNRKGHGGKGTLCSDYRGLPLCYWHHTQGGTENAPGSYHGSGKLTGWKFWAHYGVDVESAIHNLNRLWLEQGHKFKEG